MTQRTELAPDPAAAGAPPSPADAAAALDDLLPDEVATLLAEADPLWLDDRWHAACPVPGYSGAVQYPPLMDLPRYKQWRRLADEASDEDRELTLAFIYVGDSPQPRPFFFSMLYYEMALAFGTVTLERDGRAVRPDDLSSVPIALVAWLALTAKYWLECQLTFRVGRR